MDRKSKTVVISTDLGCSNPSKWSSKLFKKYVLTSKGEYLVLNLAPYKFPEISRTDDLTGKTVELLEISIDDYKAFHPKNLQQRNVYWVQRFLTPVKPPAATPDSKKPTPTGPDIATTQIGSPSDISINKTKWTVVDTTTGAALYGRLGRTLLFNSSAEADTFGKQIAVNYNVLKIILEA